MIAAVTDDETGDLQRALDHAQSTYDDRAWSWHVWRQAFTWQGFLDWWAARRWVLPRDVRKR